jgi:hypothetical protein
VFGESGEKGITPESDVQVVMRSVEAEKRGDFSPGTVLDGGLVALHYVAHTAARRPLMQSASGFLGGFSIDECD